jgi:uncharacterized membrane protein YphA (DoxX/SURF4 family)
MHIIFVIGRVALVLIFIVSGAQKLTDISGTATLIASKIMIPAEAKSLVAQIETMTGQPIHWLLALLAGIVEFAGGLLIAFNVGTRWVAALLIIFTVATTYYFHNFWNMTGAEQVDNIAHALKNLSLVGGLLMLFVLGSARQPPAAIERVE